MPIDINPISAILPDRQWLVPLEAGFREEGTTPRPCFFKEKMKTMVRQESVRFGIVLQCGKRWAFVRPDDSGIDVQLYWSHLRRVQSELGGIVFATGESNTVHRGQKVVFVPRDGLWLWGLMSEYDAAIVAASKQKIAAPPPATPTVVPTPIAPTPPDPVINFEQELAALGSAQLQKWQRRYGQKRAFA